MGTFLFNSIVFGPVKSRRLGSSLGINLMPVNKKVCNFNCIYCECGLSHSESIEGNKIPDKKSVIIELETKIIELIKNNIKIDTITFAGNGEPTLHPDFPEILMETILIKEKYLPESQVAVLTNGTMLDNDNIVEALKKISLNIIKLDSADINTINTLNRPFKSFSLENLINNLKKFNGQLIIQSLFVRGFVNGQKIDNTTNYEIVKLINVMKDIKPKYVMVYSISRHTPIETLEKISHIELNEIAKKFIESGINTKIYY